MSTVPDLTAVAVDIIDDLAHAYVERGGRVWSGAIELTPEQCQEVLADLVADCEWIQQARLVWVS